MTDVSMDYEAVQHMADGFATSADTLSTVGQALETAIGLLKVSSFVGLFGNQALIVYLENIQPTIDRLAATCEELHYDLIGAISSLRDGDHTGSLRFAGGVGGGYAGVGGSFAAASRGSFWDRIETAIIGNQRGFKFAGDVVDFIGLGGDYIPQLAVPIAIVGTGLTYLEHFEEEPGLFRGLGIATTDTVLGTAIDLHPVGKIVQGGNTIVQLVGHGGTRLTVHWANSWDIPPELSAAMTATAHDYHEAIMQVDLKNIRYDTARVLYDLQPYQADHLVGDAGHLVGTTGNFIKGAVWDIPNANFDSSVINSMGLVTHYVNNTGLPDSLKASVNELAVEVSNYVQDTNLVEMAVDLIPDPLGLFD